jgi:hypothetical protein
VRLEEMPFSPASMFVILSGWRNSISSGPMTVALSTPF